VNGQLELPAGSLQDGNHVTLLVSEREENFSLTPEEQSRLAAAIGQAERGEGIDGWRLLDELRA
jgi:hypothetical protein